MIFNSKKKKFLVMITVCACVFTAFLLGYIERASSDMISKEQALLISHIQNQTWFDTHNLTQWINYYESLINTNTFKYAPDKITGHTCKEQFYSRLEENMKTVINYPVITKMKQQYSNIYETFQDSVAMHSRCDKYPVIVTAASSNRFARSLAMIKSVKKNMLPIYKEMKFIYFDLGLSTEELLIVKKFCNCEVRPFPFDKYPPFVKDLFNYAWKPIVIYMMLREFNFVMWADASLNFNGNKPATDHFFNKAKEIGILGQILPDDHKSFYHTKEETFRLLNETPCLFYFSQIEASLITIWKTPFTWRYIVQPWIACTLTENCMSHPNPQDVLLCKREWSMHCCHRFDQSILSIILQRLFNTNIDIVNLNRLPMIGIVDRNQQLSLQSIST